MGLLDRAKSVAGVEPNAAPRGSLLTRAGPRAESHDSGASDQSLDLQIILEQIATAPQGIEIAASVFSILKRNLELEKAALLLHDTQRNMYAPWAECGLDKTTSHRLRFPENLALITSQARTGEARVIHDSTQLEEYKTYFSVREHAQLQRLAFIPFCRHEALIATLVVAQGSDTAYQAAFLSRFSKVSESIAETLYRVRVARMEGLSKPTAADDQPLDRHVQRLMESSRANDMPLILAKVSLSDPIHRITAANPFVDAFRLIEDMYQVLGGMLADIGYVHRNVHRNVHENEAHQLVLLVHGLPAPDLNLLIHQLSNALVAFFPELCGETLPDLNVEGSIYTGNGQSAEELLAAL